MYKVCDPKSWKRISQYNWFSSFENPTYGFNVKIDVTSVVNYSKETKTSFFANFYYTVTRAINDVEALRLRLVGEEIRLYDVINPNFTVKTLDGTFNNAGFDYSPNYNEFYKRCRETVEANNKEVIPGIYNDEVYDLIYTSCLTTIDIVGMTHPIIYSDKQSLSVPRIFWDRYILDNGRYYLTLNITVNHAFVDGEDLSKVFNLVRKYNEDFEITIK